MSTREHVDAVDLMQAKPFDRAAQMTVMDRSWFCCPESLRDKRDATSLDGADLLS